MAKGVKHITCLQIPKTKNIITALAVKPDVTIDFQVLEWLPGTTEEQKKNGVYWIKMSEDKQKIEQHTGGNQPFNPAGKKHQYSLSLTKKQCGKVGYYIEGSLSGYRDTKGRAGMIVRGKTTPLVIRSRWDEIGGNKGQIKSSNPTQFGKAIRLQLEVEGLNGYDCTISVYNAEYGSDQYISKYRTKCIEGNISIDFSGAETLHWRTKIGAEGLKEQFYIQLQADGISGYITDTVGNYEPRKLRHATHLYFEGWVREVIKPILPKSNNVATVGSEELKPVKYDLCVYDKITLKDQVSGPHELFNNKKITKYYLSDKPYDFQLQINYKTDEYEVPSEAAPLLKNLAKFLQLNPTYNLIINGYTDLRHTAAYNLELSKKRVNAAYSYLKVEGVQNKIKAIGHGEKNANSLAIKRGLVYLDKKDNDFHRQNRKTILTFQVPQIKAQIINLIVPNSPDKNMATITIDGYETKACVSPHKHQNKIAKYYHLSNRMEVLDMADIDASSGNIKVPIYSTVGGAFPAISNLLPNRFELRLNSCANYPDPKKPTLIINAFTDTVWIFMGKYDSDLDYKPIIRGFEHTVPMVVGATTIVSTVRQFMKSYETIISILGSYLSTVILEAAIDYFEELTNKFSLAYVKRYDFVGGQFEEKNYLETYRKETEWAIVGLATLSVILELILVYLTRGKSLQKKLPKLQKMSGFMKKFKNLQKGVEDASNSILALEIIEPKVVVSYNTNVIKDGIKIYQEERMRIIAKPLLGAEIKMEASLAKFIQDSVKKVMGQEEEKTSINFNTQEYWDSKRDSASEAVIKKLLEKVGGNAEISLSLSGNIVLDYDLTLRHLIHDGTVENKISIKDNVHSSLSNSSGRAVGGASIKWDVKILLEKTRQVVFDKGEPIKPFDVAKFLINPLSAVGFSLSASLGGETVLGLEHQADIEGLKVRGVIYFSGVKGNFKFVLNPAKGNEDKLPNNKDDNGDFTLSSPQNFYTEWFKLI